MLTSSHVPCWSSFRKAFLHYLPSPRPDCACPCPGSPDFTRTQYLSCSNIITDLPDSWSLSPLTMMSSDCISALSVVLSTSHCSSNVWGCRRDRREAKTGDSAIMVQGKAYRENEGRRPKILDILQIILTASPEGKSSAPWLPVVSSLSIYSITDSQQGPRIQVDNPPTATKIPVKAVIVQVNYTDKETWTKGIQQQEGRWREKYTSEWRARKYNETVIF